MASSSASPLVEAVEAVRVVMQEWSKKHCDAESRAPRRNLQELEADIASANADAEAKHEALDKVSQARPPSLSPLDRCA